MLWIVLNGKVRNVETPSYLHEQKILQKLFQSYPWKSSLTTQISIHITRYAVLLISVDILLLISIILLISFSFF